jgi:hypothetical protein
MLTAKQLHENYGDLLQVPPWNTHRSVYLLHQALQAQTISVSIQAVKTWWSKYRISDQVFPGLLASYIRNRGRLTDGHPQGGGSTG